MKKLLLLLCIVSSMFYSCSSVQHVQNGQGVNSISGAGTLNTINRADVNVTTSVEGTVHHSKVWFLFIPFGGGKSEERRREKVYLNTCKANSIDGIMQPKYETKKFVIPLIVFTYVGYKTSVFGKGYTIKSDK